MEAKKKAARGRPRKAKDDAASLAAVKLAAKKATAQVVRAALRKQLSIPGAAAALGTSERNLRNWIAKDPTLVAGLSLPTRGKPPRAWKLYRLRDGSGLVGNAREGGTKLYSFSGARGSWLARKVEWEGHAGRELEAVPPGDVAEAAGNTGWPGALSD